MADARIETLGEIPLVVSLFWNDSLKGSRTVLIQDTANLAHPEPGVSTWYAERATSSVSIQPGPDYDPAKKYFVGLYSHHGFKGDRLVLPPGIYRNLHDARFNFGNKVASVKIHLPDERSGEPTVEPTAGVPSVPQAPRLAQIPLVVKGYHATDFKGWRFIAVEDIENFGEYSGGWWRPFASVRVAKGPSYRQGDTVSLYRKPQYGGASVELPPGNYADLGRTDTPSIKDALKSIRFRPVARPEPEEDAGADAAQADGQTDYEDLTVKELRGQLRDRGLTTSGLKGQLVARLEEDDAEAAAELADARADAMPDEAYQAADEGDAEEGVAGEAEEPAPTAATGEPAPTAATEEAVPTARQRATDRLIQIISRHEHPSHQLLDRLEASLRTPQDLDAYAWFLCRLTERHRYPSLRLLDRLETCALAQEVAALSRDHDRAGC